LSLLAKRHRLTGAVFRSKSAQTIPDDAQSYPICRRVTIARGSSLQSKPRPRAPHYLRSDECQVGLTTSPDPLMTAEIIGSAPAVVIYRAPTSHVGSWPKPFIPAHCHGKKTIEHL